MSDSRKSALKLFKFYSAASILALSSIVTLSPSYAAADENSSAEDSSTPSENSTSKTENAVPSNATGKDILVTAQRLNEARAQIQSHLGATVY